MALQLLGENHFYLFMSVGAICSLSLVTSASRDFLYYLRSFLASQFQT